MKIKFSKYFLPSIIPFVFVLSFVLIDTSILTRPSLNEDIELGLTQDLSWFEKHQDGDGNGDPSNWIPIFADIKPGSWPNSVQTKSQGVIPIAICGTDLFDVASINPETVLITIEGVSNSVSPLRWSIGDVATPFYGEEGWGHDLEGDNILDLVLHFDIQDMVTILELNNYLDETIPILILGCLYTHKADTPLVYQGQTYIHLTVLNAQVSVHAKHKIDSNLLI